MLEIRHAIISSLFDPNDATEEYISHYTNRLISKGIAANREDISSQIKDLVKGHFVNIIGAIKTDIEARLLLPFENALMEMATIRPVLAYQLCGKEKLEKIITQANVHQQNVKTGLIDKIEEKWIRDVLEEITIELKDDALNELASTLDKDVIELAKGCGWIDHRKCKKVIATGLSYDNKYNYEELDVLLDKLIEKLTNASNDQMTADK